MNGNLLARHEVPVEVLVKEMESKGFSEDLIYGILVRSPNLHYEVLSERMSSLKAQIEGVEKSVEVQFDAVNQKIVNLEKSVEVQFDAVNQKIDSVEKSVNQRIDNVEKNVNQRIDHLEKNMDQKFETIKVEISNSNRLLIIVATIGAPICYHLLQQLILYIKG
ncbi:hypothetical protein [Candidatus Borreliella tachyglossi]|uniref:hypothetical protein n=1 Tax=Candidatus Borreliella tachyglossi TaxID=1964448 RepID=UPI0040410C98